MSPSGLCNTYAVGGWGVFPLAWLVAVPGVSLTCVRHTKIQIHVRAIESTRPRGDHEDWTN